MTAQRIEEAARATMAILWEAEQYNGVGPDYETYRESMGNRVPSYEAQAKRIATAALKPSLDHISKLEGALTKANANHEHFEREWYLRGDRIEELEGERDRLREALRDALDMVIDAHRDGTYILSEFDHLEAALNGSPPSDNKGKNDG